MKGEGCCLYHLEYFDLQGQSHVTAILSKWQSKTVYLAREGQMLAFGKMFEKNL